jgi:hypothetical protein
MRHADIVRLHTLGLISEDQRRKINPAEGRH